MPVQVDDCVSFLQWALPQLHLCWPGFRKVRKQVCKRIRKRANELGVSSYTGYRQYLVQHPGEWDTLDGLCHITISRFYRDKAVFDELKNNILPSLAAKAQAANRTLKIWSAGCASGEEPYTLSLIWNFVIKPSFPGISCRIIATDDESRMLERAGSGCYPYGSLKELPVGWTEKAFIRSGNNYRLKEEYKTGISWQQQDIRKMMPEGPFDLILCRNLVAFYFSKEWQLKIFSAMHRKLYEGGFLVLGIHEILPEELQVEFKPWSLHKRIYERCW